LPIAKRYVQRKLRQWNNTFTVPEHEETGDLMDKEWEEF
jgi:hypothetical protein